jgi:hypothetical protein
MIYNENTIIYSHLIILLRGRGAGGIVRVTAKTLGKGVSVVSRNFGLDL